MVAWDIALETGNMSTHLKYRSTITKNILPIQCPNNPGVISRKFYFYVPMGLIGLSEVSTVFGKNQNLIICPVSWFTLKFWTLKP